MSGPRRTKFQREQDRVRVTELYLRGWRQAAIAKELDVTQQQVSYDLKAIQKRWREETALNLDEIKQRELERIDELEREYWEAWQRSVGAHTKQREESGESVKGPFSKSVEETEDLVGDASFLAGVQWCISERCKILGLYAPTKQQVTGADGEPLTIAVVQKDDFNGI